ncbi:hypothetical protein X759_22280 [Mesorhizobium sp. LSHC420B00]|nr:hypothetical protein X759_22280 [Mesorhizobium sp. LSHC420B00]
MIGNALLQPEPGKAPERQPVAKRLFQLTVRKPVERLQQKRLEQDQRWPSRPTRTAITQRVEQFLKPIPLHKTRQSVERRSAAHKLGA